MKKLLSVVVLVCYMASAIGVSYALHYCGSHFKEVCFTADTEKDCCGSHEKPGCCHDDVIKVKIKDSHAPTHCLLDFSHWTAITESAFDFNNPAYAPTFAVLLQLYACDPSPPPNGTPAYILYRNLRI